MFWFKKLGSFSFLFVKFDVGFLVVLWEMCVGINKFNILIKVVIDFINVF